MPPPPINHLRFNDKYRIPPPKSLKEVPKWIVTVISTFSSRLFYIYKLVWEASKLAMVGLAFITALKGVLPVVGALISKELINLLAAGYTSAQNGKVLPFKEIIFLLVMFFVYHFLSGVVTRVNTMITRISGQLVSNHIQLKILHKTKEIDLACYDRPEFYEKMENASREASMRPVEILNSTFTIVSTLISTVSFVVVLLSISWWAPLLIAVVSLPSTLVNFTFRRKNANYIWHRSKERREMRYYSDTIVNKDLVKEMQVFNLFDIFIEKYKNAFSRYYTGLKKLILEEGFFGIATSLISTAANIFLFLFIAWGVMNGKTEIGDYSLYTGALTSISTGVATIIASTASVYEGTLFINNMISFMDERKTVVPSLEKPLKVKRHCDHTIVFDHVSFSYPGSDKTVLDDVCLTLNPAETFAIVGLNGAGKTTLIKLLTRLYDPTSGRILLDGEDIRNYDVNELYDTFGIIFQDFGKYALSVSENIALGNVKKGVVETDVKSAAEKADADSYIEALPNKYDTPLMRYFESDGTELSIGQWQKLAIARAFYSDSDILILDEPTASLDPMAEQEIFNEFNELRRGKTTLFISHRLSSATTADTIVVMEYGKIVEIGNHEELMNKKGKYFTLFSTQAKHYLSKKEQLRLEKEMEQIEN